MIIWIVEWFYDERFQPTCQVHTSRADAREDMKDWKRRNPDYKFRVVKYYRSYYQ